VDPSGHFLSEAAERNIANIAAYLNGEPLPYNPLTGQPNTWPDATPAAGSVSSGSGVGGTSVAGSGSVTPGPTTPSGSTLPDPANVVVNNQSNWVNAIIYSDERLLGEVYLLRHSQEHSVVATAFHTKGELTKDSASLMVDLIQLEGEITDNATWGLGGPEVYAHYDLSNVEFSTGAHAAEASITIGDDSGVTFYAGGHLGFRWKEKKINALFIEIDLPNFW